MNTYTFIKCSLTTIGVLTCSLLSSSAFSHGYVAKPESRSFACRLKKNTRCGSIIWEPQSLEAPKGFPKAGPPDKHIANANLDYFSELNEQSPTRWAKTNLPTGTNHFTWQFTAPHVTQGWRYFITKPGWNPSQPLTRSSFDLQPFCTADGKHRRPSSLVTHRCDVPANRRGYHIILATWEIGDTSNAFYNVIDVNVGSGKPIEPMMKPQSLPPLLDWNDIGDINPITDLKPNDRVMTRVFDQNGENPNLKTEIKITTVENGKKNVWPRLLADAINREHNALRAGIENEQHNVNPVDGKNDVYSSLESGIQRVEIKIERASTGNEPYDYVYPQSTDKYKTGTKVLGQDGHLYQCKPHPHSQWCSVDTHQYKPGSGANWQDAWVLLK